jgi:hypothetical protein
MEILAKVTSARTQARFRVVAEDGFYGVTLRERTFGTYRAASRFAGKLRRDLGTSIHTDWLGGTARIDIEIRELRATRGSAGVQRRPVGGLRRCHARRDETQDEP